MFMRAFFTHVETPLLVWFVCISSVKNSPLHGLGSDTKKIFLLASKLLVVYQATVYSTAFLSYCDLPPLLPPDRSSTSL